MTFVCLRLNHPHNMRKTRERCGDRILPLLTTRSKKKRNRRKKKKKEEDNDISLWLEYEDVQWLEETRKAREIRVPPEPAENVPRVRVYVRYCIEGDVSRIFQITESMVAVYD